MRCPHLPLANSDRLIILYATLLAGQYATPAIHAEVAVFTNTSPRAGRAGDPAACRCDATLAADNLGSLNAVGGDASCGPEIDRRHIMELTETHNLPVAHNVSWKALNDTEILRVGISGRERMEADGENAYAVAMTASAGPVKAKFKGRVNLVDIDAPYTYTIVFERQGGTAGFGKGKGQANVNPELGDNVDSTMLSYTAHAQREASSRRPARG